MTLRLVLIHGFDPRGPKVGGIETHVRQILRRHPQDMRALLVGIDDTGEMELGRVHPVTVDGREFDFMPVLHVSSGEQIGAATTLARSITFRFARAALRYVPAIRRFVRGERAVCEIERFEYAPIARAIGRPFVLVAHNEGDPRVDKMDSILSDYWYVNAVAERIAVALAARVFGVTPRIRQRLAERYARHAGKTGVLTVSVDTDLFAATPFDLADGTLRLVYAGRLDEFKDPPLMFRVARRLHEALGGAFEFHYCGSADPNRFTEFAAIEGFTVRHGALAPTAVAAVMRRAHIGVLVSHWEGMPCFLLELLASGRPFGGLRLPQYDQVIEPGISGRTAERGGTVEESEDRVVEVILAQWDDIRAGRADPARIHEKIVPWSVNRQLGRLFDAMREISPAPARERT